MIDIFLPVKVVGEGCSDIRECMWFTISLVDDWGRIGSGFVVWWCGVVWCGVM